MFGKLKSKLFSWVIIVLESLSQLPKILWSGDALLECMDLYEAEWTNSALDRTLSPLRKWIHWGPISATATIIMIGLSASILHVSWWDISTVGGFLDLLVFLTWNYLVLVNLNAACRLGAGYIKLGWHPKDSREWELLRYCHRCMGFKVPRSHHCSRCDRCVLLLDHHCPWINNCVGHRNQFAFIRFLFSAVVGCLHAAIILTSCLYQVLTFIIHEPSTPRERHLYEPPNLPITSIWLFIFAVLSVGMAYGVILAVGILLFIQLRSVSENTTGIERLFPCNNGHFIQPEENNGQNGIYYEKAKDT